MAGRRTGARPGGGSEPDKPLAAPGGPARGGQAATIYRGVRWERNPSGRFRWHDDDGDRWILWKPGQDAPPRPPGWGGGGGEDMGTPLRDKRARAGWRSPYRLVPVGLVILVVIIGAVQANRDKGPNPAAAETAAANELLGRCLVVNGTTDGQPRYEAQSVACSSPRASVRVVQVLPGTPGAPACPAATMTVRLAYPGVSDPHRECVLKVTHHR